jgi:hypothetical protein
VNASIANVAVTVLDASIVTSQVAVVPLQSPLHETNLDHVSAVAVSVTMVSRS